MTNQEAFEKSVIHVILQQRASLSQSGNKCAYAGQDQNSCAVGCLMPREMAEKCDLQKRLKIKDILSSVSDVHSHFAGVDPDLLETLQVIHDNTTAMARTPETKKYLWNEYHPPYRLYTATCNIMFSVESSLGQYRVRVRKNDIVFLLEPLKKYYGEHREPLLYQRILHLNSGYVLKRICGLFHEYFKLLDDEEE